MKNPITPQEAVEIARDFLDKAGASLNWVVKTVQRGDNWLITANVLGTYLEVKINKYTGEILEYGPPSQ